MINSKEIYVTYCSIDGAQITKKYKTLKGARKFIEYWVGHPEPSGLYHAVSGDGVGVVSSTCHIMDILEAI